MHYSEVMNYTTFGATVDDNQYNTYGNSNTNIYN